MESPTSGGASFGSVGQYERIEGTITGEVDPKDPLNSLIVDIGASVDDCGRAVHPLLIHGQSHGDVALGIGQALWEQCVYDPRSGQLLSGSLLDYALPRADLLPGSIRPLRPSINLLCRRASKRKLLAR